MAIQEWSPKHTSAESWSLPDSLTQKLIVWYADKKDAYAFRHNRNAYRTWITEIFLQQTQINAGVEKLKLFLDRFPNALTLAKGPLEDVLKAFQGMGYYSRARNMFRAAQEIATYHKGNVPIDYATLKKIPGIGHYTAAILASIHGGEKILALDANHARLLARLFTIDARVGSRAFTEEAEKYAAQFFESAMSAGDVNEALMQWGQTLCKKKPLCHECFAHTLCKAYQSQAQNSYPRKNKPQDKKIIEWLMFIYKRADRYQVFQNAAGFPFLKGEYLFASHLPQETLPPNLSAKKIKIFLEKAKQQPVDFHHTITNHKIQVKLVVVPEEIPQGEFFTLDELSTKCHSSLMRKALRAIEAL